MPTDDWLKPDWEREGIRLYLSDCLEVLPTLEAESVDTVITDPPYDFKDMDKLYI